MMTSSRLIINNISRSRHKSNQLQQFSTSFSQTYIPRRLFQHMVLAFLTSSLLFTNTFTQSVNNSPQTCQFPDSTFHTTPLKMVTSTPTTLIPSTQLSRDQVATLLKPSEQQLLEQVDSVTNLTFQQSINCCGLTSVAYALSSIGFPTTVDQLFLTVGVNVDSAVGDGMTLAEIYDATLRYITRASLPVFVECYHFDEKLATIEGFKTACDDESASGIDDIIVCNFHSGIAHGKSSGGGHFSLLCALPSDSEDVIMADVHAVKYGAFWSTPYKQLFKAMADHDSCGRARGALRFGRTDRNLTRPLKGLTPTLLDWAAPPTAYKTSNLVRYIPERWDVGLGVKNMEGASALSAALRILEGEDANIARLDEIMRALQASYTTHLDTFLAVTEIESMVNDLVKSGLTNVSVQVKDVKDCSAQALTNTLAQVGCGNDNVVVLTPYCFNLAYGGSLLKKETSEAGALSHGTKSWSLLATFNPDADLNDDQGLVIAPAHNVILAGRLWTTSMQKMTEAMNMDGEGECKLVIMTK